MDWPTEHILNWNQFSQRVDQFTSVAKPPITPYLFRGQADASWSLEPSLTRMMPGASDVEVCGLEAQLLDEFKIHASGHVPAHYFGVIEDALGWWSLMQHYRAPTRLLDWTSSPYVAAYFAADDHWTRDAAIWLYHPQSLAAGMNAKYPSFDINKVGGIEDLLDPSAPPQLTEYRRIRNTERMLAQQGYFTICRLPTSDHAMIMSEHMNNNDGQIRLLKIVIPAFLKADFLLRLRRMNIASNSLFPGIDGVGRSISELVRLNRTSSAFPPFRPQPLVVPENVQVSPNSFPVQMVEPENLEVTDSRVTSSKSHDEDANRDGGNAQDESPRRAD